MRLSIACDEHEMWGELFKLGKEALDGAGLVEACARHGFDFYRG
jgi:hypothetical protein